MTNGSRAIMKNVAKVGKMVPFGELSLCALSKQVMQKLCATRTFPWGLIIVGYLKT